MNAAITGLVREARLACLQCKPVRRVPFRACSTGIRCHFAYPSSKSPYSPHAVQAWAHSTRSLATSSSEAAYRCPSCSHTIDASQSDVSAQCPQCHAFLAPPPSLDYFTLFSLPQTYKCDRNAVRRQFLRWQGIVHPDRLANTLSASPDGAMRGQQESFAKAWSAVVNEAYKTLTSDVKRGEYLLELRGVRIEEQDKMEDPELLMEILEIREALADAQTEEEVQQIRSDNADATKSTLQTLEECLDSQRLDVDTCKTCLMRLRYQDNVENVCREWQPGKEIVLQH